LRDEAKPRLTVSELSDADPGSPTPPPDEGQASDRLIGILVHRLLQRVDLVAELGDEQRRQIVAAYLSAARAAELGDIGVVVTEAIARFRQLLSRKDVREIYLSGEPFHEVPFTMQVDGRIVRGTIDCLIAAANRITVLEFKTGKPRREHQAQADGCRADD